MEKVKVEVDIIRKITYEFTVETVLDEYGNPDISKTEEAAAEAYEKAVDDGTIGDYYSDDDFDFDIGDIVVEDEYGDE